MYRIAGAGTEEFSHYEPGDSIEIMGPLGNGFPTEGKKVFLIGGGIGIPPMLELAKTLDCEKQMILGYRDENLFLKEEFEPGARCMWPQRTEVQGRREMFLTPSVNMG